MRNCHLSITPRNLTAFTSLHLEYWHFVSTFSLTWTEKMVFNLCVWDFDCVSLDLISFWSVNITNKWHTLILLVHKFYKCFTLYSKRKSHISVCLWFLLSWPSILLDAVHGSQMLSFCNTSLKIILKRCCRRCLIIEKLPTKMVTFHQRICQIKG